jgi:hypothetical protein
MQAELAETAGVKWKDVFAPDLRRALWVGIGLAVFQQVTGINAVPLPAGEGTPPAGLGTAPRSGAC